MRATPKSSRRWALSIARVDAFRSPMPSIWRCKRRPPISSAPIGAFSRVFRLLLQSALLGLGAYLTIQGQMSAGAIIAVSVAATRALAPIDLAIGNWKGVISARDCLCAAARNHRGAGGRDKAARSAAAKGFGEDRKDYRRRTRHRPHTAERSCAGGQGGPGAGPDRPFRRRQSTLIRAIAGIWPVLRGNIRLDEADLSQWDGAEIGKHVGYLPQEVALLDASIIENISRLAPVRDPAAIIAATKAAGIHEMIVRLPDGYDTQLGPMGTALSRRSTSAHRVGARALRRSVSGDSG